MMNKSLFLTTLAAGGMALTMAACDQQQASEDSSTPMQQQGAVPSDSQEKTPAAPGSSESPAVEPGEGAGDDTMTPDSGTSNSTQ